MTAREFLTKFNSEHGHTTNDESLIETLTEMGTEVWSGDYDTHRWYICQDKVKEFDGVYVLFTDYIITGDNSARDIGLEYDFDSARVVERKERVETVVYYE